jgi:hypothetical protein
MDGHLGVDRPGHAHVYAEQYGQREVNHREANEPDSDFTHFVLSSGGGVFMSGQLPAAFPAGAG